ncbi:MAG: hypothetical protein ACW98D_21915 [Promethearchaeota archaeon]|jgi:ABC-type dipeptide/oligopeptide/nickel transport system permease component
MSLLSIILLIIAFILTFVSGYFLGRAMVYRENRLADNERDKILRGEE